MRDRVPNMLILIGMISGIVFRCYEHNGLKGTLYFMGGFLVPILILFFVYAMGALGAGDIKLLGLLGGFMGLRQVITCIIVSFFIGGIISLIALILRRSVVSSFLRVYHYISMSFTTRRLLPYPRDNKENNTIHFTVPILFSVLLYVGGVY